MSWPEIKNALNSTVGDTNNFKPLDKMLTGGIRIYKSNKTFTVPEGITEIYVTACGAGGSGIANDKRSSSYAYNKGGGSGGDAIFMKKFNVTPKSSIQITIGKGAQGSNGTQTKVGNLITLQGGLRGSLGDSSGGVGLGGLRVGFGSGEGATGTQSIGERAREGILGLGGFNYSENAEKYNFGGGGGSLGPGGDSGYDIDPGYEKYTCGVYGGGGASVTLSNSANSSISSKGGDGIVIIAWGILGVLYTLGLKNMLAKGVAINEIL